MSPFSVRQDSLLKEKKHKHRKLKFRVQSYQHDLFDNVDEYITKMNTAEISYRGLNSMSPVKRLFDNESRKNVVTNTDTRVLTTSETPSPKKLRDDKEFFKYEIDRPLSRPVHQ